MLFIQDNNAHSQNRYVHLAEYTTSRKTLVLLTTPSGQLSTTPENDSSFTSRNTDGSCSTPAVHKPLKNSHVRRHRNHSNITSASGNETTSSTQLSANISALPGKPGINSPGHSTNHIIHVTSSKCCVSMYNHYVQAHMIKYTHRFAPKHTWSII